MGLCGSTQTETNIRVNENLEELRQQMKNEVTLLLLGPGESGKSTIFKQFKILYGDGFSLHEKQFYLGEIKVNVISQTKVLVDAAKLLNFKLQKNNREKAAQLSNMSGISSDDWNEELALVIKDIWNDKGIQNTYEQRSKFQLNDSTKYFMDNIDRILENDFLPTTDDILRSRVKTVGAVEERFHIDDMIFRMIDVGGQRAERRKWLPCFASVTSVLFIVGLNEYDQQLREDNEQNRMTESLVLFDQVCNSGFFRTTNFILFFNKVDLLEEKLGKVDLSILFPSYEGGTDIDKAKIFIANRFIEKNHSPHEVYYHFTCAVDTQSFSKIFNVVKEKLVMDLMNAVQHL